jgi:hypothetical protein
VSGVSLLVQFLFRMSFGLALGMAITSPRKVTSGYYRNHLYVLLGLNVLATLVALSAPDRFALWPALSAAILSYLGSVCWLYEKAGPGILALAAIAAVTLVGAWSAGPLGAQLPPGAGPAWTILELLDPPTSGLVLGLTIAAMFLGHWYLNTPTMALAPLERLIKLMGLAIIVRAVVAVAGLALQVHTHGWHGTEQTLFLLLRWLSGLVGALLLSVMAWKTLKIPNTQAATGILYVAVIATFLGELTSLLMSSELASPV